MSDDAATQAFLDHRRLVFTVAYDLLGTIGDAEDVVQETWLSWTGRGAGAEPVAQPRAYLVRIAVNHALARRAALARDRLSYVGQWLPEPVVSADGVDDAAVRADTCSLAMLVVLESLSPLERAVFVLREVFGFAHPEIADMLGRSPEAVRQLAHRARSHVRARRPRYPADPQLHRDVTERFMAAALGADLDALLQLLAPDVTLRTDGGSAGPATSTEPVRGAGRVARLLVDVATNVPADAEIGYRRVNGDPAVLLSAAGTPFALLVLDLAVDAVRGIYAVTNPDKLARAR